MGIDLELADCAAAGRRLQDCSASGVPCGHDPRCAAEYDRLLASAAADRPGEDYPWEFRYRRFHDINETMAATGMGHGIPAHKLESNDQWLVTVEEIDTALAAYRKNPVALRDRLETDEKWAAWLEWLTVARRHGGFEAE